MSNRRSRKRKACKQSMEGELQLPEVIIQHIQSLMEDKCAARTSLLSKSWYNAWFTGPFLVLDNSKFRYCRRNMPSTPSVFWNFARNTVHRYMHQNLSVDKFTLRMKIKSHDVSFLDKFIIDAASKLRVNELNLVMSGRTYYAIPVQLFEQRYLPKVCLVGCKIDQQLAKRVLWPHLLSLTLSHVYIEDDMLCDILSRCPLIEYLELTKCSHGWTKANVSEMRNLKTLIVESYPHRTVFVEFGECRFLNLSKLVLKNVKTDDVFFSSFTSLFPYLKDLTLGKFDDRENIQISSHSVKFLNISLEYCYDATVKKAKFDVPNISKFMFSGHIHIPTLSFSAATKQWESEIKFSNIHSVKFSRFLEKLRNLLEILRQSKISLHITDFRYEHFFPTMRIIGVPPVLENLVASLNSNKGCNFLMATCGLLWSYRPKFVNLFFDGDMKAVQFLYEKLIEQSNRNCCNSISAQDFCWMHQLNEVNAEFFEEFVMGWKPIKALLDASDILHYGAEQLRFKLIWGSFTPELTIVNFVKFRKS